MENSDVKEKLRGTEQRVALIEDAKNRLETDLGTAKKSFNEKHLELEVS